MKALVILMLPALMLIGCGKLKTNEATADQMISEMNSNGSLSNEDANNTNGSFLDETVTVTETDSNSVMMKLGGAELLIDFVEELSGDPQETAMVINGVEVATQIVADPQSFQGLIASLVTAQLEKVDILGIPAKDLVEVGMKLVNGDTDTAEFSNVFGTLVRGALNMWLSKTPFGSIFDNIANSVLGNQNSNNQGNANNQNGQNNGQSNNNQNQNPNNNNQNNNNQNSGNVLGSIIDGVGGALSGSNPLLGGLFSLITNLFK